MTTVSFKLPGGFDALAEWTPGDRAGVIYADPVWLRPVTIVNRRVAEDRADAAVGAHGVRWTWKDAPT